MAIFEYVTDLDCDIDWLYDFLIHPANAVLVTPPQLKPRLLEGPERLEVGSRLTMQIRRFGLPQTMHVEVKRLEPGRLLQDDQVKGPFRRWSHTHTLQPLGPGRTRMIDRIEFEKPAPPLGWLVTESFIRRDLEAMFRHREQRFRELAQQQQRRAATGSA